MKFKSTTEESNFLLTQNPSCSKASVDERYAEFRTWYEKEERSKTAIYLKVQTMLIDQHHASCIAQIEFIGATRPADGVVELLEALKIARETGAEIKMTPLMWEALKKLEAAAGCVKPDALFESVIDKFFQDHF